MNISPGDIVATKYGAMYVRFVDPDRPVVYTVRMIDFTTDTAAEWAEESEWMNPYEITSDEILMILPPQYGI